MRYLSYLLLKELIVTGSVVSSSPVSLKKSNLVIYFKQELLGQFSSTVEQKLHH
jgi:hypothetical protein